MKEQTSVEYNCANSFDFIKSIAVLCVFLLHVSLFSGSLGFVYDEYTWPLKTPAWSAVWIMFILSGYFIGKGFFEGRYAFNVKGFLRFYLKRFVKIGVATWIFIFINCTIVEPDFIINNPKVLFRIISFTYYNLPQSNGIGATWYVSTLMHLYLIAPFICLIVRKIMMHIRNQVNMKMSLGIIVVLWLGFYYRYHMFELGVDWSSQVYVPFYANLDLYISGILLNYINFPKVLSQTKRKIINVCTKAGLFVVILLNCYIYYRMDYSFTCGFIYQYVFPSIYIIVVGLYIKASESCMFPQKPISIKNIIKNPLRLLDLFSSISFEFYLVHSLVLSRIYIYFTGSSLIEVHLKIVFSAFVISTIWAVLLKRIFSFNMNVFKKLES